MKLILALIGAYLIVGPIYVRRKLTEPNYVKVPLDLMRYKTEGGIGILLATAAGWPIGTFINREFGYWIAFAMIAAAFMYL